MQQEPRFISKALQGVYLQFRDNDKWITVRDLNISSYERLNFYDDRVREYINLDKFNLNISYQGKEMKINFTHHHDLLLREEVSNRLRLAMLSNNKWIYIYFQMIVDEDGRRVMKPTAAADDPSAINVVYKDQETGSAER